MKYIKLEREGRPVWGVLEGDLVRTLAQPPFGSICYDGGCIPLSALETEDNLHLLAPCEATKIICVGKNYYDHAVEMGDGVPDRPILFMKGPNTINHPDGAVHAPSFVERLDYEGELAFVISRCAKNVKEENFADYIIYKTIDICVKVGLV